MTIESYTKVRGCPKRLATQIGSLKILGVKYIWYIPSYIHLVYSSWQTKLPLLYVDSIYIYHFINFICFVNQALYCFPTRMLIRPIYLFDFFLLLIKKFIYEQVVPQLNFPSLFDNLLIFLSFNTKFYNCTSQSHT